MKDEECRLPGVAATLPRSALRLRAGDKAGGARASSPALGLGGAKTSLFARNCRRFKRAGTPARRHDGDFATGPALRAPRSECGVALVVTLVLITVITFMAVTFLIVSRSQHGAVATTTDQAIARLAANAARDRAIVEALSRMMAQTNEFSYGMLVATNYFNPLGFDPGAVPQASPNPTNVNYDYTITGAPLTPEQRLQNIANLLYAPRPPVFITNRLSQANEFRFYLDLNRNGLHDPSGLLPEINPLGGFYDLNGDWVPYAWPPPSGIVSNFCMGDPEWIGLLQRPEYAHSSSNLFIARYTYLVVPAGQTLDINTIHNDAKLRVMTAPGDGFLRNQGVGTWEINLAAFLADLNTNLWPTTPLNFYSFAPYAYDVSFPPLANQGAAFDDAFGLLHYRYATNVDNLAKVQDLFGNPGALAFQADFADVYSGGPVMDGLWWPPPFFGNINQPKISRDPWSGGDNPNRYFTTQDLFDSAKTRPGWLSAGVPSFTDRLKMAGTNVDSYNRYTFYRLLSQLGTDSAPEPSGKMNLNYRNVDEHGYVVPNMVTNFIPWTPEQFFTNAAVRLLADAGYAVGHGRSTSNLLVLVTNSFGGRGIVTTNLNIPIWPTNYYTPSVHRLLQLAANLYDATTVTNEAGTTATGIKLSLPTIFRPVFAGNAASGYISVVGYREVTSADTADLVDNRYDLVRDLTDTNDLPQFDPARDMAYNVPLVIGAKKGFPNFNEFVLQTQIQVTRKLQFHRPGVSTTEPVNEIDQMFVVGITNTLGIEAWNSYATNFPRGLTMVVWPDIGLYLTNRESGKWLNEPPLLSRYRQGTPAVKTNFPANSWPGYASESPKASFQIPLVSNVVFLPKMTYRRTPTDGFVPLTGAFERTIGSTNFYIPQWSVRVKARLRFALVDDGTGRIVDYVNLADDNFQDLTEVLTQGGNNSVIYTPDGRNGSMWLTNRMYGRPANDVTTATFGIQNQIEACFNEITVDWKSALEEHPAGMSREEAIQFFEGQFIRGYQKASNTFHAPFQPFRNVYLVTSWQANDPLVHYMTGDLRDESGTQPRLVLDQFSSGAPTENLGRVNDRYEPWGRLRSGSAGALNSRYEMAVKDPVSTATVKRPEGRSDDWDFPTNRLPNIGWVGRIHRGTPWQTVYLKPQGYDPANWQRWTGNGVAMTNFGQLAASVPIPVNSVYADAYLSQPTNDWRLLDLFTTALNDNATRGQLSINQTNLAAWSAVLSGVIALTNFDVNGQPGLTPYVIAPAGVYNPRNTNTWTPVARIVNAINAARANTNAGRFIFPNQTFRRLGDILTVPELTIASPFLNTNVPPGDPNYALNDAAYERLPQQIAGLLKVDSVPRFVIYSFGQALKPALRAPFVTSGDFRGLCTNYQIMAETATRTVVRFEGVSPYQRGTPTATRVLHPVIESSNVLPLD